jgi:hypothetical protein
MQLSCSVELKLDHACFSGLRICSCCFQQFSLFSTCQDHVKPPSVQKLNNALYISSSEMTFLCLLYLKPFLCFFSPFVGDQGVHIPSRRSHSPDCCRFGVSIGTSVQLWCLLMEICSRWVRLVWRKQMTEMRVHSCGSGV